MTSYSHQITNTYTGREWDKETGLYYYRARYYDPMEGRFISKDPSGFEGGINLWAYVQNNPINRTDPSGLIWVTVDYDYAGVSNWLKALMNYITDRIGTGMEDPNFPGSSPNHYVGTRRDVIQEWQHDPKKPCRDDENAMGARRRIPQTYTQFINGGPRNDLTRNPDDTYYYQWSPWVSSPTY